MTGSTPRQPDKAPAVRYYDAHNHLQDEWLAPHQARVVEQLEALPVTRGVVNGTWEGDWTSVELLTQRYSWVLPSFGLHPWWVGKRTGAWRELLLDALKKYPEAGLGEIGLDRWILDRARPDDPRLEGLLRATLDEQTQVFTAQLKIAAAQNRAATVHCIDAWGALWDVLRHADLPARGFLLHAYGGSAEMAAAFAERGAYFSFSGYFLGDRKQRQQELFRELPLERLLIETDAPSMPLPQAWRTYKLPPGPSGTPLNHPANIEAVYAGLAALRGIPVPELSGIVEANFQRFFFLK